LKKAFSANRLWFGIPVLLIVLCQASAASPEHYMGVGHHLKGGMGSLLNEVDGQ